jgi:SsrA-binding protein
MNISTNRKAKFDYQILEEFSAGIVLLGSEVKSVRLGHITLNDSFIYLKDGEVWIKNLRISRYHNSHKLENHDETREKKLLLTKKQINQMFKMLLRKIS